MDHPECDVSKSRELVTVREITCALCRSWHNVGHDTETKLSCDYSFLMQFIGEWMIVFIREFLCQWRSSSGCFWINNSVLETVSWWILLLSDSFWLQDFVLNTIYGALPSRCRFWKQMSIYQADVFRFLRDRFKPTPKIIPPPQICIGYFPKTSKTY